MTENQNPEINDSVETEETIDETVEETTAPLTRRQRIFAALKAISIVGVTGGLALSLAAIADNASQKALDKVFDKDEIDCGCPNEIIEISDADDEPTLALESSLSIEPIEE